MEEQETKKRPGRARLIVFIVLVVVVAAGIVAYVRIALTGFQATDDAAVDGNQVVISAQTLDRITTMNVGEGDQVAKGQVVALLDNSTLKAQGNQAEVNLEYAGENVKLAQVKMNQAQTDFQRATVQYQNRIISQEQYDHAKVALSASQAEYSISLAQVKLAKAQLATVQTSLAYTILSSPIDGVVAKKWAMPGDVVQPAQPVYTLYDLARLWIEANFKETQIHYLRPGDPATITVDAFPGRVFKGKVETIGAATASEFALIPPENGAGNFTKVTQRVPVRISIDNEDGLSAQTGQRLLPGMSAEVKVVTPER